MKPVWTTEHDKIVDDYKKQKAAGKVKGFVVVPRGFNKSSTTTGYNRCHVIIHHNEDRGYHLEIEAIDGAWTKKLYLPLVDIKDDFEGWFLPE